MRLIFKQTKQGTLIKCPNPECGKWIKVKIAEVKSGISIDCPDCKKKWGGA